MTALDDARKVRVAEIPASQMPWEWCTKVCEFRGRKKTFNISVNGRMFLRARANNIAQLLSQLIGDLPKNARVHVKVTR